MQHAKASVAGGPGGRHWKSVGVVILVLLLVVSLILNAELCDLRFGRYVAFFEVCSQEKPRAHRQQQQLYGASSTSNGFGDGNVMQQQQATDSDANDKYSTAATGADLSPERHTRAYTPNRIPDTNHLLPCSVPGGGVVGKVVLCNSTFPDAFEWRSVPRERITGASSSSRSLCGDDSSSCEWVPAISLQSPVTSANQSSCEFLCSLPSVAKPQLRDPSSILVRRALYVPKSLAPNIDRSSQHSSEDKNAMTCMMRELGLIHPGLCMASHGAASRSPCAEGGWTPTTMRNEHERKSGDSRPLSILAIGHSHSRFIVAMLCMMLLSSDCANLEDQFRVISFVTNQSSSPSLPPQPPVLTFVQANYVFGHKIERLKREWYSNHSSAGNISNAITHVFVSKGSWDLLFYDRDPLEIVTELEDGLLELLETFPNAHFIQYMPHWVHIKSVIKPSKKMLTNPHTVNNKLVHNYNRMVWRKRCFSERRLSMMRDVNMCSAYRATMTWWQQSHGGLGLSKNASRSGSASLESPIFLFDIWRETRTQFGLEYVDILGHHYQDLFLESVSAKLLASHVCPGSNTQLDSIACPRRLCLADGAAACSRLEAIGGDKYVVDQECACHNIAKRSQQICKKYGRGVPDLSSRN